MSNPHSQKFAVIVDYDTLEELWFAYAKRVERAKPERVERLTPTLNFLNYILMRHTPGMPLTPTEPEFEKNFIQISSDIWTPGHEVDRRVKLKELTERTLRGKQVVVK